VRECVESTERESLSYFGNRELLDRRENEEEEAAEENASRALEGSRTWTHYEYFLLGLHTIFHSTDFKNTPTQLRALLEIQVTTTLLVPKKSKHSRASQHGE